MTLTPLIEAGPAVQVHVLTILLAALAGPIAFLRRARDRVHRVAGRVFVVAMGVSALSSFLITELALIGPFGPIHLISVWVLWQLWHAVAHIRRGDVAAHGRAMGDLYFGAIGVAGLFTLFPGRRMSLVLFPDAPVAGFAGVVTLVALVWIALARRRRRARQDA